MSGLKQRGAWLCYSLARFFAALAEKLDVRGEVFTKHGTPQCWTWRDY